MTERIQKLRALFAKENITSFFVTNPKNIFYLTGFQGISPQERESTLLVTQENMYLFLPKMYAHQGKQLPLVKDTTVTLVIDHERYNLLTHFSTYLQDNDVVGCEMENLSLAEYAYIKKETDKELLPLKNLVATLRQQKDATEIAAITKACKITTTILNQLRSFLTEDDYTLYTELDIVDLLRTWGRDAGADGFGYDPIVAVGANSALPHHHSGNTHLQKNQPLLIDVGFVVDGYTADITRTWFLGTAPEEFKQQYAWVLENNMSRLAEVAPGISCKTLFENSVAFFAQHHVNDAYIHSLGHGIGLNIHESPNLSPKSDVTLDAGMVITIEPGIYFPNQWGIRIEDDVLVTNNGSLVLTNDSPKKLIEIHNTV